LISFDILIMTTARGMGLEQSRYDGG